MTAYRNFKGPSNAAQLEPPEPWADDMRKTQAAVNQLTAVIGGPACKQWQTENLPWDMPWSRKLMLVRNKLAEERMIGEVVHRGAQIARECGVPVDDDTCQCVLPDQHCPSCDAAARKVYGADDGSFEF